MAKEALELYLDDMQELPQPSKMPKSFGVRADSYIKDEKGAYILYVKNAKSD